MKTNYLIVIAFLIFVNCDIIMSQENPSETRKIVINEKGELYYQKEHCVFSRKHHSKDPLILATLSAYGGHIHPEITKINFITFRNCMAGVSRDKFYDFHSHEEIVDCPWIFRFECLNIKNYKKPNSGVLYRRSTKNLNLPDIEFFENVKSPIFYDFVVHQNSILLLIMIDYNLTIYKGSENVCDNQWELKYSLDTNFKSDYFVGYVDEEGEICMLHDIEGAFKIDFDSLKLNKWRQTDKTKRNIVFDEKDIKYYLIDDKTAACLIESENTIDYFNQSIKNNKNGK